MYHSILWSKEKHTVPMVIYLAAVSKGAQQQGQCVQGSRKLSMLHKVTLLSTISIYEC